MIDGYFYSGDKQWTQSVWHFHSQSCDILDFFPPLPPLVISFPFLHNRAWSTLIIYIYLTCLLLFTSLIHPFTYLFIDCLSYCIFASFTLQLMAYKRGLHASEKDREILCPSPLRLTPVYFAQEFIKNLQMWSKTGLFLAFYRITWFALYFTITCILNLCAGYYTH